MRKEKSSILQTILCMICGFIYEEVAIIQILNVGKYTSYIENKVGSMGHTQVKVILTFHLVKCSKLPTPTPLRPVRPPRRISCCSSCSWTCSFSKAMEVEKALLEHQRANSLFFSRHCTALLFKTCMLHSTTYRVGNLYRPLIPAKHH